ncbi:MAG: C4-dicarboxylate transporter DcuC, partial [Selenomonadaceae bacterium]
MVWIGAIIVLLTLIAIAKRYETRMVLCVSGLVMAAIGGNPLGAMDAFSKAMVNEGLVTTICTVMGFSFVMKFTGCDTHLVQLLAGGLKRVKLILVPGAILITWLLNIALSSTAGTCAAVGAVLIPTLIRSGVRPAMAGACIMVATFASVLNPGFPHAVFIAGLAKVDVMDVIGSYTTPVLVLLAGVLIIMTVQAKLRGEGAGSINVSDPAETEGEFKVDLIKAVVPIVPLVVLVLATPQIGVLSKITIPQAMIMGAILGFLV